MLYRRPVIRINESENAVTFVLRKLTKLTNRLHCNYQREALTSRLPVMMMPFG